LPFYGKILPFYGNSQFQIASNLRKSDYKKLAPTFRHPPVDQQDLKRKATNYNKANANDITL